MYHLQLVTMTSCLLIDVSCHIDVPTGRILHNSTWFMRQACHRVYSLCSPTHSRVVLFLQRKSYWPLRLLTHRICSNGKYPWRSSSWIKLCQKYGVTRLVSRLKPGVYIPPFSNNLREMKEKNLNDYAHKIKQYLCFYKITLNSKN
jgi:hypothetical protein